jgi:hypothetical protein
MAELEIARTYIAQPLFIATLKAIGSAIGVTVLKAQQSIESITDESITQFIENTATTLDGEIKSAMNFCTARRSMVNVPEEDIITDLICKIISLNELGETLNENTLYKLASILNVYSNNEFIAMHKRAYDAEKSANRHAILKGAIAASLSGAVVDTAMNAIKFDTLNPDTEGFREFMKPGPAPKTMEDVLVKSAITSSIAIGASAGVAMYGIQILQKINNVIPLRYKPKLKTITTAIMKKIQEKEEMKTQIQNIVDEALISLVRNWKNSFVRDPTKNLIYIDYDQIRYEIEPRLVFKMEKGKFVFEDGLPVLTGSIPNIRYNPTDREGPTTRSKSAAKKKATTEPTGSTELTGTILQDTIKTAKTRIINYKSQKEFDREIKELNELFYQFVNAYSNEGEDAKEINFLELTKQINPLIESIDFSGEHLNIDEIKTNLRVIQEQARRRLPPVTVESKLNKISNSVLELISMPFNTAVSAFTRSNKPKAKGRGRKTRKNKRKRTMIKRKKHVKSK